MSPLNNDPTKQQDPMDFNIIDANTSHYEEVLALNERLVHYLSPLSLEGLQSLADQSNLFKVVVQHGKVVGFFISLREGQPYESVNYRWFSQRYPAFLYIDRIVISQEMQGKGLGKALYQHLFDYAREKNITLIAAEIYSLPPNKVSLEFHKANGFLEVGRQMTTDGSREVSMQLKKIQ